MKSVKLTNYIRDQIVKRLLEKQFPVDNNKNTALDLEWKKIGDKVYNLIYTPEQIKIMNSEEMKGAFESNNSFRINSGGESHYVYMTEERPLFDSHRRYNSNISFPADHEISKEIEAYDYKLTDYKENVRTLRL